MSSWTEAQDGDEAILSAPGEAEPGSSGTELFPNDRGTLNLETRRALVLLLQGPSIDGSRQPKLWQVLRRDEALLRQHLHNLFLDLVVDYDQSVAFTRQVVAESIDAPVLLRRNALTFLESALVLLLRQRLTQADAQGERAVLSKTEMFEHLRVYERDRNVDHARFERQMDNAVEKAKKLNLLHKTRGSDERYEVSPTLKLLFPAEDIEALARTYRALATAGAASAEQASLSQQAGTQRSNLASNDAEDGGQEEDD